MKRAQGFTSIIGGTHNPCHGRKGDVTVNIRSDEAYFFLNSGEIDKDISKSEKARRFRALRACGIRRRG
jgi:hypothetical protein